MRPDKDTVEQAVSLYLGDIHSFLKVGQVWEFRARGNPLNKYENEILTENTVDPSEHFIGVYVNSNEDLLIVTAKGIHWVQGKSKKSVPYDSIVSIAEPSDVDQDIDLTLSSGDNLAIPVLNSTDEIPDIYAVYDFLQSLDIPRSEPRISLRDVKDKEDLLCYIDQWFGNEKACTISPRLHPTELQYWSEELQIDPELLRRGDTWRLIGLFLGAALPEKSLHVED